MPPPAPTIIRQMPATPRARRSAPPQVQNPPRRRGKQTRKQGRTPAMLGGLRAVDTEVLALAKDDTLQVMAFSPGKTGLTRLDAESAKYMRWRLNRVTITYEPTGPSTSEETITYGILPGSLSASVTSAATIMKLRPFHKHTTFKSSSITVSSNIMSQQYLYTSGIGEDEVAFCLYLLTTKAAQGVLKISYDITLAYPKP